MGGTAQEAVLHELDYCRVVHGRVRNIMPSREWRDDHVRHPEAKLRGETLHGGGIRLLSARVEGS